MAKQKKFKKIQMPKVLDSAKEFIAPRIVGIIVLIVFIVLAWVLTAAFFEKSDYFKLKSVEAKGALGASLSPAENELIKYYKGANIFRVDLKAIARYLEPQYPDARDIIVKRELPDKLLVEFNFRKPVAILSNGQNYPVDREGVILVNRDTARLSGLPVIKGVDPKYAGKPHKQNESRNLKAALSLLEEIKKARFLDKYGVRVVDASDIKSLSFYLGENGPLIIMGYENITDRLSTLKYTLRDPRLVLDKINYIDVRFKDVAISPK